MPLSKHYIDTNTDPVAVDPDWIRQVLESQYPQIRFALLLGSAVTGVIRPHSDLDLAIYCLPLLSIDERLDLISTIEQLHKGVRCDLGILNNAEPAFCFEALKGRLILVRDWDLWARFFSLTCRLYEAQMFHYKRQLYYRLCRQEYDRRSTLVS